MEGFLNLIGAIGGITFFVSLAYSGNKWRKWQRGFGRGGATLTDFKLAMKWSVVCAFGLMLMLVANTGHR